MKKAVILALVMVLIMVVGSVSTVLAAEPINQVMGGGTVLVSLDDITLYSTYAFTAIQTDGSGNAKGNLMFHSRTTGLIMNAKVLYLAVAGNEAWIGGEVTATNGINDIKVGDSVIWHVQDNGEGKNASGPDRTSAFYTYHFSSPSIALNMSPYIYLQLDWTNGNVQIK